MKYAVYGIFAYFFLASSISFADAYGVDEYKNDYQILFPVVVEYDQKCFRGDAESCKVSSAIIGQLDRSLTNIRTSTPSTVGIEILSNALNGYVTSRKVKIGAVH